MDPPRLIAAAPMEARSRLPRLQPRGLKFTGRGSEAQIIKKSALLLLRSGDRYRKAGPVSIEGVVGGGVGRTKAPPRKDSA